MPDDATIPDRAAYASTVVPTSGSDHNAETLDEPFERRYELRAVLGEGGMGEVRLCKDKRIGREIAVKTVRPGHGSRDDLRSRFLREARVQAQLEHPSIVPVYDIGRDPSGAAYFSMKRVRGQTLEDILFRLKEKDPEAARQYSRRKLLTAFASVCMTVHFAHTRGVLHRDLKPSNVMLGDFGEVYVLDWGLARILADEAPPSAGSSPRVEVEGVSDPGTQTVAGAVMGTPGYMAPEQARGETRTLDARADVYALGAILFEIMTLQPLHARSDVKGIVASTLGGVDARALIRAPELDVPPELEAIWLKATALREQDRHASARELYDAVERFLDGDRDLERRRELSLEHARAAEEAADRALRGDALADRAEAMREVSRAIALDPGNRGALKTVVRLLSDPPREMPAEARAEIDAGAQASQRTFARIATSAYASWFLYFPLVYWMGIRNNAEGLAVGALWAATAVSCWLNYRNPHPQGKIKLGSLLLSNLAIGAASLMTGPFILVPGLAAVNAVAFTLSPDRSMRALTIALSSLTIVVPALLAWLGIVVPFYEFTGDRMAVSARVLAFPALPSQIFFLLSSLALVITAALMIARFRDNLSDAERRIYVQAWQLRQLVPAEAHVPASTPPPPAAQCPILDR